MLSVELYQWSNWRLLKATNVVNRDAWENILNSGTWSGWIRIATATPPEEYDLPLAAGWQKEGWSECKYSKTQDGIVHINFATKNTADVPAGTVIATLPVGYRPTYAVDASAVLSNAAGTNIYNGYVVIDATGVVSFGIMTGGLTSASCVRCSLAFVAA